jgi:hypothetical protein
MVVGAVQGDNLTYNATTGLFEPSQSASDDYATSDTQQTGLTTTTDITDLVVSFEVVDTPKWVVGIAPLLVPTVAPARCSLNITQLDNTLAASQFCAACAGTSDRSSGFAIEEITTPGEYDRKLRLGVTAGTWTIFGGATGIARLYTTDRPPFGV